MSCPPPCRLVCLLAVFMASVGLLTPISHVQATSLPWASEGGPLPSLAPMLETVVPAVVNISTAEEEVVRTSPLFNDPFFQHFFRTPGGQNRKRIRRGIGTGVIWDAAKGYVVTNHHVIAKASDITIRLHDAREVKAEVVGSDDETDLAILKIDADQLSGLPRADSTQLRVGDFVVAIGNPFGLNQTVTSGIISALGRSGVMRKRGYEDFIQTDASINPGNSGGALVNLHGELVGINTAIYTQRGGSIGIGFAIPVQLVQQVADQLIEHGQVQRGQLGVQAQKLTLDLADALNVDPNRGVVVTRIIEGSPADEVGLRPGDVLLSINGEALSDEVSLRRVLGLLPVGSSVEIELHREGESHTVHTATATLHLAGERLHPSLAGLTLINQVDDGKRHIEILSVYRNSLAWRKGLRPADHLLSVNRQRVLTVVDLQEAVAPESPQILLQIRRGQQSRFILMP